MARLWPFFRRLQWKLTLAYALFTAITALVLGVVGLALLWYFTFGSNGIPTRLAGELLEAGPLFLPFLEGASPDRAGLNDWLAGDRRGDILSANSPAEADGEPHRNPFPFDRAVSIAITDSRGRVLAGYPGAAFSVGDTLPAQIPAEAVAGFEAALRGVTDPGELAARNAADNVVATAPIFDSDNRLSGAVFVELASPFSESQFLRFVLRQTILPVVLGILMGGGVAGIFFGYFIARDLTRRLDAIAGAADAWSNGNFEVLAPADSGDELGRLARRLNQMTLQLQTLLQTRQELAMLDERNRLARDLHDAVKQQVFATSMQIGAALTLIEQDPAAAKMSLVETDRLVRQTQQELTSLIQELRPAALEDKGLTTALREYINDWSRQSHIAARLRVRGEQPMAFLLEQTLFRVTQEALANVARHSGATEVEVYLAWEGDQVTLTVADNGRGFNPAAANGGGLGLRSMRERVEAIGGRLTVASRPESGTQVTVHCDKQ